MINQTGIAVPGRRTPTQQEQYGPAKKKWRVSDSTYLFYIYTEEKHLSFGPKIRKNPPFCGPVPTDSPVEILWPFFMQFYFWFINGPIFIIKCSKYVSCKYYRLNGCNSTLQAA